MTDQPPQYPTHPPAQQYPHPWPPQQPYQPPQQPYTPHIIMTTYGRERPRQSCAIHALLLCTTFGLGNIVYAIWHSTRHN